MKIIDENNITFKTYFHGTRKVSLDNAKNLFVHLYEGISTMSGQKKIDYINEKKFTNIVFELQDYEEIKEDIKMKKLKYVIRDRQAGNEIEKVETLEEAKQRLNQYEKEDKKDGIYTPNFYEIYDIETKEVID